MAGFVESIQKAFKKPDPKELVRKWQADLRAQQRAIDRQIRDIQFEEKKVQKAIKDAAKRNDLGTCKVLAKEILHSRKAVGRLYTNKAQMMSVGNALTEQLAMLRVSGTLQKSTDVMKLVNDTLKLPEMQKTMMEMSKEMARAGLIDEMMNDALDSALDNEDIEDETEDEIQKVLLEVAGETLAALPAAKTRPAAIEEPEELHPEDEELRERLHAMRTA
eukprot:GHUV01002806.1.p1 GENE.GHUV01002806.1~~GHUV01002806.1.p1  ORF type:complete len:219 (+),score=48.88 GHUV01002806.1:310-966(+)